MLYEILQFQDFCGKLENSMFFTACVRFIAKFVILNLIGMRSLQ
jgi:hypothetical protein